MTDEIKDSYGALELKPGASQKAVKEAYRELVKVWHPDRFSGDSKLEKRAEEKLKAINLAYERLKNHRPGESGAATFSQPPKAARAARGATPPRAGFATGVKTFVIPNTRDAKLGCLLLGGVGALIGSLILISLFYDDSHTGRRYVTNIASASGGAQSEAQEGASNQVGAAEIRMAGPAVPRDVDLPPVETLPESDESAIAELEKRARASAIADFDVEMTNRVESVTAPDRRFSGTARMRDDLAFMTKQYYSTGMAHLRSTKGAREATQAVHWFRRAAEKGHPDAQYQLAVMLRSGTGVEVNPERAFFWLWIAGAQGHREALRQRSDFEAELNAGRAAALRDQAQERLETYRN